MFMFVKYMMTCCSCIYSLGACATGVSRGFLNIFSNHNRFAQQQPTDHKHTHNASGWQALSSDFPKQTAIERDAVFWQLKNSFQTLKSHHETAADL